MKLLISGATGFIGSHLIQKLIDDGNIVCAVIRPSTNLSTINKKVATFTFSDDIQKLEEFMTKEKFDGVIHLASLFLAQHSTKDIKPLIDSNLFFSLALLEASAKTTIPWFINTGTFWQHYKNKKYSPVNLYAATKQAFETIAQYYIETSSINFVTIKLSDTFGPGDTRPKIFALWKKIANSNEPLDMSPGKQLINISYIDNVVDGYLQMIQLLSKDKSRKLCGKSYVITSTKVLTLRELAQVFQKVTKKNLKINWGKRDYRPREVMRPWSKGEKIPGWKAKVSLEEGIRRTII
jgi:CDP-paratose synthetase